jgi:NADPH:quinone reductase-like Zn-dependent oxidoreductase
MVRNRSLQLQKVDGKPGQVYYPLRLVDVPIPEPGPGQVVIRISAAALNHRDLFIRQHLYPAISLTSPLFADGVGTIVSAHPSCKSSLATGEKQQRVVLNPSRGWAANPSGPEDPARFAIVGSCRTIEGDGTAQDFIVVHEDDVVAAPAHLTDAEAACLPLVGVTAWRALTEKSGGHAVPGSNVLITGAGGGVALAALQIAVARGCRVWVTSSDPAKIEKAKTLGAAGGVNYKDADWDKQLGALLPKDRPYLDLVVDGAGGDIVARTARLLHPGRVIAQYGMTSGPRMDWSMQAVLKNIELRGTTMGSRGEFCDMVAFVTERGIKPVVSRVVAGLDDLDAIDGLFEDMKLGRQFGKLVVEFARAGDAED